MDYISVKEAAGCWGVTVRRVQQYCKDGLLPGATKVGNTWMVPKEAKMPAFDQSAKQKNGIPDVYQVTPFRQAMPLLCSSYEPGQCVAYIQSLPDLDDRAIALGEYCYFSGQAERAAKILEPYLDSRDPALRFSASLICAFANLSRGHIHLARFAMQNLQVRIGLSSDAPPKLHAMGILTATAASVLLHMPLPDMPPLRDYLRYLPGGLKLWGCYVLAHQAYLEQDYAGALAMAEMGLALSPEPYPIAEIYTRLVAVMALMNLKQPERAQAHMEAAWALARPDDLLEPFGEHHGLLQGMIEVFFKKDHPKDFDRIIAITYAFSAGWRKVHNPETRHDVADNLTTTEFTVAMLYSRGWSAKEIGAHMGLSDRRIRDHLSVIYEKLGVNRREELNRFMLI